MKKSMKILLIFVLMFAMVVALTGCAVAEDGTADPIAMGAMEALLDILATAAVTAIGIAGTWATTKIAQGKHLENIGEATAQVIQAAQVTVGELQQTTVAAMKAAAPDGKLSKDQIEILKREVLRMARGKLTEPTVQLLEACKMDVNAMIRGAAEDAINQMHTAKDLASGGAAAA